MAKQAAKKRPTRHNLRDLTLLNHRDHALAASNAGVIPQLHPVTGTDSARLLLISGGALSYVSFRRAQTGKNGTDERNLLGSTASLLYPCLGGPHQPLDRQL